MPKVPGQAVQSWPVDLDLPDPSARALLCCLKGARGKEAFPHEEQQKGKK